MRVGSSYWPALDGVRALAIVPVVGFHVFGWPLGGGFGVDVFFVLSGFLITSLLLREHEVTGALSLRTFYVRRVRRLMPALAVMLATVVTVAVATGDVEGVAATVGLTAAYGMNVAAMKNWSFVPASLTHMWSLSAEEQFYLIWPVALVLALRYSRSLALVICSAAATVAAVQESRLHGSRLVFSPEGRSALALLVGCASAFVASSPTVASACRLLAPLTLGPVLFATLLPDPYGAKDILFVCAIAVLVVGLTQACPLMRLFSAWPVAGLGRISYSLYLWHLPVVAAIFSIHLPLGRTDRQLASVLISVAVATASYAFVERRFRAPHRGPEMALQPEIMTA